MTWINSDKFHMNNGGWKNLTLSNWKNYVLNKNIKLDLKLWRDIFIFQL